MVQRYEQTRKLQWYKRGAAYELALIIIGVFVLILGIILGYAMIHEYRMYLDDHYKARYSFRDFIKRERFYIYLFFASIFIFLTNLLYFLA